MRRALPHELDIALRSPTPKAPYRSFVWEWDVGLINPITCQLEHQQAEVGLREDGVQIEPDIPECAILAHAYLGHVDLLPMLHSSQIAHIEEQALKHWKDSN